MLPPSHPPLQAPTTEILLVNLGTPAACTWRSVAAYLREFLSDRRVIQIPFWIWKPLLYGVVLPFRTRKSLHAYQRVWTAEGSPLRVWTQHLAQALQTRLAASHEEVSVTPAMRYGKPSIAAALKQHQQVRLRHLIVVPLYPQSAESTTASVWDAITTSVKPWRYLPSITFLNGYWDHPAYIHAMVLHLKQHWDPAHVDVLLFSFHGLPERALKQGDPYHCFCQKSARLLAEGLGLKTTQWRVSFQSRFGKGAWLSPDTLHTLQMLAEEGQRVAVICPGFAVDCVETLEEIDQLNRAHYLHHGGPHFEYIPCLNDSEAHLQMLEAILRPHLSS